MALDFRRIDTNEIVTTASGDIAWISAEVGEKVHFINSVPAAVIKFSSPCLNTPNEDTANYQQSLLMLLEVLNPTISGVWSPTSTATAGKVMSIPVTDPGSGYSSATINITGDGNGAAAQAVIRGGSIESVIITAPGSGYTSASATLNGNGDGATLGDVNIGRSSKAYCGIYGSGAFNNSIKNVDINAINNKGFFPFYEPPISAVIPLKSNIRTYGPYVSSNFATDYGGITADTDQDLAPWVFGSTAYMNSAGIARANEFPANPLKISEAGSATVLGFPSLSLGQQLNVTGPYLNSMNINFGSTGVTTTLSFQTFTAKFGSLSNSYRQQFKSLAKNRQQQLQFLRNQAIASQKLYRRISGKRKNKDLTSQKQTAENNSASMSRVLVGEIYDWEILAISGDRSVSGIGQRTVVGAETLSKSIMEMRYDYANKAYMSWDGLLSPISISGGGIVSSGGISGLPMYAVSYTGYPSCAKSVSIPPIPPVIINSGVIDLNINQKYLNPLTNPFASGQHHHAGSGAGHVIDIVGRGTGVPESGIITNFYNESQNDQRYNNDYRFLGLKGPLVLHAWGYDTQGKPIPNATDNINKIRESGIFATSGLKDQFLPDWLHKPATWPVAPIDLRFDRTRGVWVSPPAHKIVVAQATEDISAYSSGQGILINEYDGTEYAQDIFDSSGNLINTSGDSSIAKINIVDRIGSDIANGEKKYAYFDPYTSQYLLLGGGGGGSKIKIGRTNGSWPKFDNKPVSIYKVDPDADASGLMTDPVQSNLILDTSYSGIYALNLLKSVTVSAGQEYWCVLMDAGGMYILLEAECGC